MQNIGQAFLDGAERRPDLLAIVDDRGAFNHAQVAGIVRSYAQRMAALGIGRTSLVAVASDVLATSLPVTLALALLGARWIAFRNAAAMAAIEEPSHFLCSPEAGQRDDPRFAVIDESWSREPDDWIDLEPAGDPETLSAPWLYFSTSGTTGTPKLLALSQEIMTRRVAALGDDFTSRSTVYCGLFPCFAPPYVTFTLAAMLHGCTVVRSHDFGLWDSVGVTLLHGSVKQITDLLGSKLLERKLPQVHVGGAKTPDRLARHLLQSFERLIEVYAATETNRSFKNEKRLGPGGGIVTVGRPLDSRIEIVDAEGALCEPGEAGLVRVTNGYLAPGYLNNLEAEARAFRDGGFYPGDLGSFGANGELIVLGRSGDVINLGGIKINAAEIDDTLRATEGIADAVSFEDVTGGTVSEIVAFVIFEPDADRQETAARAAALALERLGRERSPARLIPVHFIPRANDGGAQRFMCKELYARIKAEALAASAESGAGPEPASR